MLTERQEVRLREAFSVLVDRAPDLEPPVGSPSQPDVPVRRRLWRPALVGSSAFLLVLAVFLPLAIMRGDPGPTPAASTPSSTGSPTVTESVAPEKALPSFGEPTLLTGPGGEVSRIQSTETDLYASGVGTAGDTVLRWDIEAEEWQTVLTAAPGDSEGRFVVGRLIMQIIEDDAPARDTVVPGSAVTGAPRVLIFDPATGETWETTLPRPADPSMEPLPLDGSAPEAAHCSLGGYQSWVRAHGGAVGDRLVVIGSLQLVGKLADGTVMCDGQSLPYVWTSDDDGHTWDLSRSAPMSSIAWSGDRFVGWSQRGASPIGAAVGADSAADLVESADGIEWVTVAATPPLPDGSFISSSAVTATGDTTVAWATVSRWTLPAPIPDDVTDPEQLRPVLGLADDVVDIDQLLAQINVDLPLDETERAAIEAFAGNSQPVAAVIAVSWDRGGTWSTNLIEEPLTAVAVVNGGLVAAATQWDFIRNPVGAESSLLVSADATQWSHGVKLTDASFGVRAIASTDRSLFVLTGAGLIVEVPLR